MAFDLLNFLKQPEWHARCSQSHAVIDKKWFHLVWFWFKNFNSCTLRSEWVDNSYL
jgi:hypothetical protein